MTTIPPPPRRIRRRPEAGGAWLLWFVVVGGMVLAFTPLALLIARHLVLSSGQVVEAAIDDVYLVRANNKLTPHVKFHYLLAGRTINADQEIDETEQPDLQPGRIAAARVRVFFGLPHCFITVPSAGGHPTSRLVVAIGTPVGSWVLALIVYGQDFRDRRLVKTGIAVAGTITGHQISDGRSPNRVVDFEFLAADGSEVVGRMRTDAWAYARAKIGDVVTVLYDPARVSSAAVYELCTYEVKPTVL